MRLFLIAIIALSSIGCTIRSRYWKLIDGKMTLVSIVDQRGIGKAKHPEGAETQVDPIIKVPDFKVQN